MTTPPSNVPTRSNLIERYGPLTGIVVAILVIGALVTFGGGENPSGSASSVGGSGNTATSAGAPAASDMPLTYEQAKAEGKEKQIQWVDNCDPATGRIKMPSLYAPPCVPKFTGDNGGDLGPGVTKDKITVVFYLPQQSGDVMAQLAGNIDTPEATRDTVAKFNEMLGKLANTYGRTVDLQTFQSTASATDPLAARAEAQQVIDTYHPFASISGPALTTAYAEELAAQGVVCLACGGATSDDLFQKLAPHMWGATASTEEWLATVSDYLGKRVAKRPARWAGDPALRSATRKFGIVNFEQDPPQFKAIGAVGAKCGDATGWSAAVQETYLITNINDRAPTIIAKLKAEKITTVIFMGDPIMPITLTKEATKQDYFPEWIVTGTAFTDIAAFGRRYDQKQWEHAFGLSQLSVFMPPEQAEPWRLHQWYFGQPPAATKTSSVIWSPLIQLYSGIHMAGPKLSPATFGQGLFNLPPAGGTPVTPRVSYGNRKTFPVADAETCKADTFRTDYLGIDDMVEIWWDPTVDGPDEQGKAGTGKYRYANGGKRYLPGQMPDTEADAFKVDGSVLQFDTRPPSDKSPDYPPPAR
jgi:hypothetical protein